jgi:hypothetical protein
LEKEGFGYKTHRSWVKGLRPLPGDGKRKGGEEKARGGDPEKGRVILIIAKEGNP